MFHHLARLLLFTCLAGSSASETEQSGSLGETSYGPSSVVITGVPIVTVGIPYGFECTASCYPSCQYSWTTGNVTTQGPELSLQLLHAMPTQTLSCTAVNPTTGESVTVHKTLQVTAGPSNMMISGPTFLTYGVVSTFTCSADCYPSCTFSWNVVLDQEVYRQAEGKTISVTPPQSTVNSETLVCEAQDTVSQLYISTTHTLWVASVSDIIITSSDGSTTVVMGKTYSFVCSATCTPYCEISWKYMGKTYKGGQVQLPILHQGDKPKYVNHLAITFSEYSETEPLTCVATNSISHESITTTQNLTVIDPFAVHPVSEALPVAGKSFSLQCVGSQNPESITWMKNKEPIMASERVRFTPDNVTMTFSPLLETDDGLYQCVVDEGGPSIQSIGYKMQVNYGPTAMVISGVDIVTVGVRYSFQCSASCYPKCTFTWTTGNVTSEGPELNYTFKELQLTQTLICTAVNPATGMSVTAKKALQMTAGPSNMHISGPSYLTGGATYNFTCSVDCYPSCSFNWTVFFDDMIYTYGQGNTISVTPPVAFITSGTLICEAQDTVSHLHISKSINVPLARLSNVVITGNSTVAMGQRYTYTCSATCIPFCVFTWKYMGKIIKGDKIQIPILHQDDDAKFSSRLEVKLSDYSKTELLTCEVMNQLSNATLATSKNLTVIDPFSVHPASKAPPIADKPFSLECVGAQYQASITWLKNKRTILTSPRVHLSADNSTLTFNPLLRADGGLYQCLILEDGNRTIYYDSMEFVQDGTPILSVGYLMTVNYGPDEVLIVKPNIGPVGEETITLPGSITELHCSTDCYPACTTSWFYRGALLATNASIFFTPVAPPYEDPLTCLASNPVSEKEGMAETTVVVPDGPNKVTISGPDALETGVTASFTCQAECTPSCSFTWNLYGATMTGSVIDITANRYISKESISCQAENTFTGRTETVNETLSVSDPHWCGC